MRDLTPEEAQISGVAALKFNSPEAQKLSAAKLGRAQDAEKAFYEVFKDRCKELGINENSNHFGICTGGAFLGLDNHVNALEKEGRVGSRSNFELMLGTAKAGISKRIYGDMVTAFAGQTVDKITIQSFTQKAKDIFGFFEEGNDIVSIEASLREAIRKKHTAAFNDLSNAHLDPAVNNPKVEAIEKDLRTAYEAEQKLLNEELGKLCGAYYMDPNGDLFKADAKMQAAKRALDGADAALRREFFAVFGVAATSDAAVLINLLKQTTLPEALKTAQGEYEAKLAEFVVAKKEFDDLEAKRVEIGVHDYHGHIVSGKLAVVNANLGNAGNLARAEATKLGQFYKEMTMPVGSTTQQVRYDVLHRIIGA